MWNFWVSEHPSADWWMSESCSKGPVFLNPIMRFRFYEFELKLQMKKKRKFAVRSGEIKLEVENIFCWQMAASSNH